MRLPQPLGVGADPARSNAAASPNQHRLPLDRRSPPPPRRRLPHLQALEKGDAVTKIDGSQLEVAAEVEGKVVAVDLAVWLVQATTQPALYENYASPQAACLKVVFDRVSGRGTLCWYRRQLAAWCGRPVLWAPCPAWAAARARRRVPGARARRGAPTTHAGALLHRADHPLAALRLPARVRHGGGQPSREAGAAESQVRGHRGARRVQAGGGCNSPSDAAGGQGSASACTSCCC